MTTSTPPRSGKLPLSVVLIAALAAGLGLWAGQKTFFGRVDLPETHSMRLLNPPRTVPAFELDATEGRKITQDSLKDRWTMVFLGFTHCPDVCPMTLSELAKVEKSLQDLPEPKRPQILFISVDPERDTPEVIANYAKYFSPNVLSATSDIESLNKFASSISMVFAKSPLENGDYTVDHTSWVAVFDPEARLAGYIRPPLDPDVISTDLRALVEYK